MNSRKQELYLRIFDMILPFLRNIQRQSALQRMKLGAFYDEVELVHNLPRCLTVSEMTEYDVYWLNTQARMFVERGGNKAHGFYDDIVACLTELVAMVPPHLKHLMTWQGPEMKKTVG